MIKSSNKILYIGAGCHIEPVIHFKQTKEFVFIDTQPRNEFDSYTINFIDRYYRNNFLIKLINECTKFHFVLKSCIEIDKQYYKKIISWKQYFYYMLRKKPEHINPTLLTFINNDTQQKIHYYISTNILFNVNHRLQQEIESCDGLIVSGFHPNKELLQYIKTPINFYGYTNTHYNIFCDDEKNNIIYHMHLKPYNIKYYFKNFFMVTKDNGTIYKCYDFDDFKLTTHLYHSNIV